MWAWNLWNCSGRRSGNEWWGRDREKTEYKDSFYLSFCFGAAGKFLRHFKTLEAAVVYVQSVGNGVRLQDRAIARLPGAHGKYLWTCQSRSSGISRLKKPQWAYLYQTAPVITFSSHYCAHFFFSFMNFLYDFQCFVLWFVKENWQLYNYKLRK